MGSCDTEYKFEFQSFLLCFLASQYRNFPPTHLLNIHTD